MVTIKNLGAGALTATEAALVNASAGVPLLVSNIRITNTTASSLSFTLKIQGTGGSPPVRFLNVDTVPAYSTKSVGEFTLDSGWQIRGTGGTGLDYVASGMQMG